MSNALALITEDIYGTRDKFSTVLVDKSLNFEREAGFAIQVLSGNDYALSTAAKNRQSVVDAVTNIAAIGISLNPAKKQAYLVPRGGKICLDISYMGLLDLAIDSGSIMWGRSEVVYSNDRFTLNGFDKEPEHGYEPFDTNRGEMVGVYVVVKTAIGDYLTTTMPVSEVDAIKQRSESGKKGSGPWKTDYNEMAKKTVIKRAYKMWPKTERLAQAIHMLNTESGEGIDFNAQERGANWINVEPMIVEATQTKTDADALAYWKSNNAKLGKQPADHTKLKEAVARHRAALRSADEARTVDMPASTTSAAPGVDPDFVAAMDGAPDYVPE
jgi:recombination protein RecT